MMCSNVGGVEPTAGKLPWPVIAEELRAWANSAEHAEDVIAGVAAAVRALIAPGSYEAYFELWERNGLHVTPVHYESPVPELAALPADLWTRQSELVGLDLNDEGQLDLLRNAFPQFRAEYDAFPHEPTEDESEFYYGQTWFSGTDATVLYCMVRHFCPQRIIEVGSGFSTRVIAKAVRANDTPAAILCIEPYAGDATRHAVLSAGIPGLTLLNSKVEEVELELFEALGANDIVFIDSSHVSRIGSDVNHLLLEVLPRLRPGVIVHVHDIHLPWEYPRYLVMNERRFFNEQYLIQAFLCFNHEFEILFSNAYVGRQYPDELRKTFPNAPWWGGGSLWLRRRAHGADKARR